VGATASLEIPAPTPAPAAQRVAREQAARARRRSGTGAPAVTPDPDRELVARWQRGDEGAFESLVRRHQARVFRFLVRLLGDTAEAEDVAQETFLALHRHGHRFRGEALFTTFVYRVAANAARNRLRSRGRYGERLRRLAWRQAGGHDLPHSPRDPQTCLELSEAGGAVQRALLTLPPRLRLPVVLYDVEDLAYGEIARTLGIAEGTVKSRIHRARSLLRAQLAPLLQGSENGDASSDDGEDGA